MSPSNARLRLAIEASNDGIWDWNILTGETFFSDRYFSMLGYDPDTMEHSFATWEALLHPEDRPKVKALVFTQIERSEVFSTEFRMKAADGSWRWILGRGKVMERDESGNPVRMVGTHVDIHEQIILAQKIREQNEELTLLNRLGMTISKRLSINAIVESALRELKSVLKSDLVLIFFIENNHIVSRGIHSDSTTFDTLHAKRRHIGECLCGRAVQENRPFFTSDVENNPYCTHMECRNAGIRSFAAMPLTSGEDVFGVMGMGSKEVIDYSLRRDFLESVAAVISSGVDNARLHQQLRRHSDSLETIVDERNKELRRLQNAIEHASVSILMTDAGGKIEYANPYFTELTGYSREEVLGQNPRFLKSGEHTPEFYKEIWDTLAKGRTWQGEICNLKKDGSRYWENATLSPVLNDAGRLVSYVAVKEDITERKQQEQQLLILSKAIRNAASSVVVTDLEGIIVYVNPSFTRITGFTEEEALGRTPGMLQSGIHDNLFYHDIWATITLGQSWEGEILNRHKDGRRFWMSTHISPVFNDKGDITHFVGVQNDISEKKELEQLKVDVERIMRHDLKTPLNGIIGFPPLIEMEGNLTPDQQEMMTAILKSAQKMLRMIDLSQDFFRIETGKYEYQPIRLDLLRVLDELLHEVQSMLTAKGLTINLRLNGSSPAEGATCLTHSDERLLYSLLSNLISNALEASPTQEAVDILLDQLEGTTIRIRNRGVVPKTVRPVFFQKYKTFGKKKGTGLGTYSAKVAADAMGYALTMRTSDEANETVLTIKIPEKQKTSAL